MTDYRGYPTRECPECENQADCYGPADPTRQFGPGEHGLYRCTECEHQFIAIVPEPPDRYEGDGVFADSH